MVHARSPPRGGKIPAAHTTPQLGTQVPMPLVDKSTLVTGSPPVPAFCCASKTRPVKKKYFHQWVVPADCANSAQQVPNQRYSTLRHGCPALVFFFFWRRPWPPVIACTRTLARRPLPSSAFAILISPPTPLALPFSLSSFFFFSFSSTLSHP